MWNVERIGNSYDLELWCKDPFMIELPGGIRKYGKLVAGEYRMIIKYGIMLVPGTKEKDGNGYYVLLAYPLGWQHVDQSYYLLDETGIFRLGDFE